MNKYHESIIRVESLDHEIRGFTHIAGKATFIEGALPSERVKIEFTQEKQSFNEARTISVITAHPKRVTPKCGHFEICGGCRLQHMDSEMQIHAKQNILAEQLKMFANCTPETWLPPIPSKPWAYRTKARIGVKYNPKKGVLIGFREKWHKRFIADLKSCEILDPRLGHQFDKLKNLFKSLSINAHIPQLEIATTADEVAIILRHLRDFNEQDIERLKNFARAENFKIYLQPKGLDSIHLLYPENGDPLLTYQLPEQNINLQFFPSDFTQVNYDVNRQMIKQAMALLDCQPDDQVLDLFCGIGNFSLPIAQKVKQVIGIEFSQQMVKRAQRNAKLNDITNATFFAADLTREFGGLAWIKPYDKILLDRPRTGALEIIKQFPKFSPQKIVYVSCNPSTLARDTKELIDQGYRLNSAGIMDMFPHTRHVEAIAEFAKG